MSRSRRVEATFSRNWVRSHIFGVRGARAPYPPRHDPCIRNQIGFVRANCVLAIGFVRANCILAIGFVRAKSGMPGGSRPVRTRRPDLTRRHSFRICDSCDLSWSFLSQRLCKELVRFGATLVMHQPRAHRVRRSERADTKGVRRRVPHESPSIRPEQPARPDLPIVPELVMSLIETVTDRHTP